MLGKANGGRPGKGDDHYRYGDRPREAQEATRDSVVGQHAAKRERFIDEFGKGIILISRSANGVLQPRIERNERSVRTVLKPGSA